MEFARTTYGFVHSDNPAIIRCNKKLAADLMVDNTFHYMVWYILLPKILFIVLYRMSKCKAVLRSIKLSQRYFTKYGLIAKQQSASGSQTTLN